MSGEYVFESGPVKVIVLLPARSGTVIVNVPTVFQPPVPGA